MASGGQNMTTYKARYLAGGIAQVQQHLNIAGTTYFGASTSIEGGKPILAYDSNYPNFGLRYFESEPDVLTISATNNNNSKTGADFSINGLGNGILSHLGNYIPHTGNTTGTVGGGEQPVYVNAGTISATSYALKATVNNGSSSYLTYYNGDRTISYWPYAKFHDGCLSLFPTTGNFRDGIRIHCNSGEQCHVTFCGNDNTGDTGTTAKSWLVGNNGGNFYITNNGATNGDAYLHCVNHVWSWNGTATGSISGNAGTATKLSTSGTKAQFWRGDNTWSSQLEASSLYLTVKTTDAGGYAAFRLATAANGEAAILFINGASRTSDGGANILTLRNNVGSLRLNNNTFNTGTFTVGSAAQTSYNFQVNGSSNLDGIVFAQKLMLRRSESAGYGRISFYHNNYHTWFMYMTPSGTASPTGQASANYGGVSSWAIRFLTEDAANYGWVWESCSESTSSTPDGKMALRADNGDLTVKGTIYNAGNNPVIYQTANSGTRIAGFRNQAGNNQAYYWGFNGSSSETYAVPNSSMSVGYASSAGSAGSVSRAVFGDSNNGEHNCNSMTTNGLYYYTSNGPTTSIGATTNDGACFAQNYSTAWGSQIAQDYRDGDLFVRGHNNGTWTAWNRVWRKNDSVTGAVWNDYAEARAASGQPGQVVYELGDDTCVPTTERLQHFAGIVSDTWGFSQGETDSAKTHIAVAGRVLAYPYRNRDEYKPGDVLCAAPDGTVDIMSREEVIQYPDRIVGTVSCVPEYEEWGGGEGADRPPVKVNGRIWVKVR